MSAPNQRSPRESLASILSVESRRDGEFLCRLEDFWGDSLGSDALARALLAAADGCEGKDLHAVHAGFFKAAPPGVPITLLVERIEDSPRLARRQVRLLRDDLICQAAVTFVTPSEGPTYQDLKLDPDLPAPQALPTTVEQARAEGWPETYAHGPIEFRRIGALWPDISKGESCAHTAWVRPRLPLPDDRRLHMAALVFLSDFYSHWAFERRIGRSFAYDRFRTLDYALWVHRFRPWDDWWLLKARSEVGDAGRALARRELYSREGILIASASTAAIVGTGTPDA